MLKLNNIHINIIDPIVILQLINTKYNILFRYIYLLLEILLMTIIATFDNEKNVLMYTM